jgi:hypothetical protein
VDLRPERAEDATTPFAAPSRRAAPALTSTPFLPFASAW